MSKSYEFNTTSKDKSELFQQAAKILIVNGLRIMDLDITRPWGFFLSVDEAQAAEFINKFYAGVELDVDDALPLRPKFLGIAPGQRLSWQYHHRRAETWRTLAGVYGLITSDTDQEGPMRQIAEGEVITLAQGERHRGVGLANWALVAEIWQHTDPNSPSNEEDIVRIQDDYNRE